MRRLRTMSAAIVMLATAGCTTTIGYQTPAASAAAVSSFRAGEARMLCGIDLSCAIQWGRARRASERLLPARRWDDVAEVVMAAGYDVDLAWYFLGLAAEGAGLPAAARIYYEAAVRRSLIGSHQHCGHLCDGFNLPADAQRRLAALAYPAIQPSPQGGLPVRRIASPPPARPSGATVAAPVAPPAPQGWVSPGATPIERATPPAPADGGWVTPVPTPAPGAPREPRPGGSTDE